ncbi:MAG: hypothetical protein HFI86_02085 [Bacilli bacterium]|nr:hypothetical protein [Bacilli bacterium]
MKYKIIKEYEHFYVCEYEINNQKIRESFIKDSRVRAENGYLIVKKNYDEKTNVSF